MSSELPGLGITSCYTEGECDWTDKINDSFNKIAVEHFNCVTATDASTITNTAASFTNPQPGDAYVDAAGCLVVYMGPDKGWLTNPPLCGRRVYDHVNKITYVWDNGSWKVTSLCLTVESNTIVAKGPSAYPAGTLAYNTSTNPAEEFVTINGVWIPTSRAYDSTTCEFLYTLKADVVADDVDYCVQADPALTATPATGKLSIFAHNGTLYKKDDTGAVDFFVCDSVFQAALIAITAQIAAAILPLQEELNNAVSAYVGAADAAKLVELNASGLLDPCFINSYPSVELASDWVTKYGAPTGGERRYVPSTGRVLVYDSVLGTWRDEAEPQPMECFVAYDSAPSGVNTNTVVAQVWNTVNLDLEEVGASYANLSAGQFQLDGGCCYSIDASVPGFATNRFQSRLFDVTNGTVVTYGTSGYNGTTGSVSDQTTSDLCTEVCITADTTYEIQVIYNFVNHPESGGLGNHPPWEIINKFGYVKVNKKRSF